MVYVGDILNSLVVKSTKFERLGFVGCRWEVEVGEVKLLLCVLCK